MDQLIRQLSMGVSKATTRRGFVSGMIRGMVGMSAGTLFLFGGNSWAAFNNGSCNNVNTVNNAGTNCDGAKQCKGGDDFGCLTNVHWSCDNSKLGINKCVRNSSSNGNPAYACPPGTTNSGAYWACCCSGKKTYCADCWYTAENNICICPINTGLNC